MIDRPSVGGAGEGLSSGDGRLSGHTAHKCLRPRGRAAGKERLPLLTWPFPWEWARRAGGMLRPCWTEGCSTFDGQGEGRH